MCLGVPGKVLSVEELELRTARVDFGGIVKQVCLAYTPDADIGDYVIVHAGFAISRIDVAEARRVFDYIRRLGELSELESRKP